MAIEKSKNQGDDFMGFMKLTEIITLDKKEGYSELSLRIGPKHLNYHGYVHGGVYFTISDSAAGMATSLYNGDWVTLNSSINYLNAVKEGELIVIAKVINKTKKIATIEVKSYNCKLLCTDSVFIMYRVK